MTPRIEDEKNQKINKGAPSGFVISLMVHAAAFALAGLLVVFTVHQKEEKTFVPPRPVDRPKMKLKKPQVKVKKSAKPKSTTRIVTKVKRASIPDIQLPEMSGMGVGIVGDIGGFEMIPDLEEMTVFVEVLLMAQESAGLKKVGTVSVDGIKIQAVPANTLSSATSTRASRLSYCRTLNVSVSLITLFDRG